FNVASSTVSNGTYAWDLGDAQNRTGVSATHRYVRNGTFTVTLSVTSDTKATSTSSRTINVSGTLPPNTATFTFSPTNPAINQDVTFNANSGGGGGFPGGPAPGVVGTYTWDFGDGTTGSGVAPVHTYGQVHTYTVTMTVVNAQGQSATISKTVPVIAAP